MAISETTIIYATRSWVKSVVVELNLCPFARSVFQRDLLAVRVLNAGDTQFWLEAIVEEAQKLADISMASRNDATTLVVFAAGLANFDDFLDLTAMAEALLDSLGFDGTVQIASFHPNYQFAGNDYADASNYSNRSPYPMLHLLREESVSQALVKHPDPAGIPIRNINRLRELGHEHLQCLLEAACGEIE